MRCTVRDLRSSCILRAVATISRMNFVSGVGVEIKLLRFLLAVDARRRMMRGGEDGAVER